MNTPRIFMASKIFLALILLSIHIVSLSVAQGAEEDPYAKTKIETVALKDGIYMLKGAGGNIGVSVGDDGIFMIDDQFAPLTEKIKAAIKSISDKPIRFLINTHWHFDHSGGNENFGRDKVIIVAHENVRERMSKEGFIKAFGMKIPASPKIALPVITFNDTVTFHLNGQDIQVVHHSNAHTDGDSVIFFKSSNVIHTGDIFFNGFYPFIDSSSDGSVNGMIKTVEHLLTLIDDETKIIPGHGPMANKKDLESYLNMLVTSRDRMQKLLDEGKSLEEIIAILPLADFDKSWGLDYFNPETFLKILHSVMPKSK